MRVSDFDFDLPGRLIAQDARPRGESRLLAVDRASNAWRELAFRDLPNLFDPGDLLVINDTRVFAARLIGRRDASGGAVECFLLRRASEPGEVWEALVHPGQKLKPGTRFVVEDSGRAPAVRIRGEILDRMFHGRRRVRLEAEGAPSLDAAIDALGHVPLPPYIHRGDNEEDRARYQTVYARARGSVAAPTAGLHFDEGVFAALDARGIRRVPVTLHVGYGTFKPVRVDEVEQHVVDPEPYEMPADTAAAIAGAKAAGSRVAAVGTTTTRALEHWARTGLRTGTGTGLADADLFIYPGFRFEVVDALLTNFHLPKSSLFMLVCAFAGRELMLEAYREAIRREFRFYSYGDAMLIL
ncbi:MAG TPA: tRNA preQ1(34) S-adenosylmethionine ribosyltransferase-isomerase QueA [Vicinamibacterales bacterium]|nr:tRNA preQ1(34) S-adenosylmethionine ribosyltransferase-isomerase QueA [Vicinamibacterales bacterium]